MDDSEPKLALRKKLHARRSQVSAKECETASRDIAAQVFSAIDWSEVRRVHVYDSIEKLGEIDTKYIVEELQKHYPKIEIVQPPSTPNAPLPTSQFDVIFAPVLGFDRDGFRLGMGGGWYDRFLATQTTARAFGLAYAWAEVDELFAEPHDVPLEEIFVA